MSDSTDSAIIELQTEIQRLNKIIRALMNRVERCTDIQGSDFTLFQSTLMLEEQIRLRTAQLEQALGDKVALAEKLRKSEAKFSAIFNMTPDPIALTRMRDGMIVEISHSFADYFGINPEQAIGRTTLPGDLDIWVDEEERRQWVSLLEAKGEVVGFEARMRKSGGEIRTVLISGKMIEIEAEYYVVGDIHDISNQKQEAAYYESIASHDPLTGLPNRLALNDRLHQAIARSRRTGSRIAICYLDLDGFKGVNDRFGHQAGDQVLVETGKRLSHCVRSEDTVARLGGDEFVVIFSDLDCHEGHANLLQRLLEEISKPYLFSDGCQVPLSASIGVTGYPQQESDPWALIQQADESMYEAKRKGKNQYCLHASMTNPNTF
ncbi:MAG: sensor domain-containing diguanylate cyclase [Candidatus Thiodiazotropha sp.]|jgi:diguanylate cyclase (GGDEF)-like protein/PAS domain S-box-containing protein